MKNDAIQFDAATAGELIRNLSNDFNDLITATKKFKEVVTTVKETTKLTFLAATESKVQVIFQAHKSLENFLDDLARDIAKVAGDIDEIDNQVVDFDGGDE